MSVELPLVVIAVFYILVGCWCCFSLVADEFVVELTCCFASYSLDLNIAAF